MNWRMREVVLTVILAIICGIIYLGWSTLSIPITAIFGPVGSEWMFGIWVIASPLIAYIIRKPGAALIAELAASAVEVLTGSQFGLSSFLVGIFQGLGSELAFALYGYKRFTLVPLILSGIGGAIGNLFYNVLANGFGYYTAKLLFIILGIRIVSGAILGGYLAKVLADSLRKTGVLQGYAITKERYHENKTTNSNDHPSPPRL